MTTSEVERNPLRVFHMRTHSDNKLRCRPARPIRCSAVHRERLVRSDRQRIEEGPSALPPCRRFSGSRPACHSRSFAGHSQPGGEVVRRRPPPEPCRIAARVARDERRGVLRRGTRRIELDVTDLAAALRVEHVERMRLTIRVPGVRRHDAPRHGRGRGGCRVGRGEASLEPVPRGRRRSSSEGDGSWRVVGAPGEPPAERADRVAATRRHRVVDLPRRRGGRRRAEQGEHGGPGDAHCRGPAPCRRRRGRIGG